MEQNWEQVTIADIFSSLIVSFTVFFIDLAFVILTHRIFKLNGKMITIICQQIKKHDKKLQIQVGLNNVNMQRKVTGRKCIKLYSGAKNLS